MGKRKELKLIIIIMAITCVLTAAYWIFSFTIGSELMDSLFKLPDNSDTSKSFDENSGVHAVIKLYKDSGEKVTPVEILLAKQIIGRRLKAMDIRYRLVTDDMQQGTIRLDISKDTSDKAEPDYSLAIDEALRSSMLTLQEIDEDRRNEAAQYLQTGRIVVSGKDVESARAEKDIRNGGYNVAVKFNSEGTSKFEKATGKLIGKRIGIYIDKRYIMAPSIYESISDGEIWITGMKNLEEANKLAADIMSGSVKFKMKAETVEIK